MDLTRPRTGQDGTARPRRRRLAGVLLACGAVALGAAAPGRAAPAGEQIARQGSASGVPACVSCHGARGEGGPNFPRLAGSGESYLRAQLEAFASGARQSTVMQPFAQKLSADERAAAAAYFAAMPPPFAARDPGPASPGDAGAWLATRGRWADGVPACNQCHGPGGGGVGASFPPLAGLPDSYIAAQLQAIKAGTRQPGPLGLMAAIARKLTAADVQAVSAYYAKLGAASQAQAPGSPPAAGKQP